MEALLEVLRQQAASFGPKLGRLAYQRGLAVTDKDGSTRPIPITATPVVVSAAELRRRTRLSALLSSAGVKMSREVLGGPSRELLLSALSPIERTIAERTWQASQILATTRVDFFVGTSQAPLALEINATIPAMQGYSDIAAGAFLEVVGRHFGLSEQAISGLVAQNQPNAPALYQALLEGFRLKRQRPPERIALLCRRQDAQLTEQQYLARRFGELGTEAEVVHPDELSGTSALMARGKRFDLLYRHLFLRRLEEPDLLGAPYLTQLLGNPDDSRVVVLNPPASQVEVKTTFALLSQAAADPALAKAALLTDDELGAIVAAVPWTRPFRPGPAVGPDGEALKELVERVAGEPGRFVLKRSWDYGGRAVFVGRSQGEESFVQRVRSAYGKPLSWAELCAVCAEDRVGGGFVVQQLVPTQPEPHLLCTEAGLQAAGLYVDFSAYASVGLEGPGNWGGVCRGSPSQIVNIMGGGGVLPLLTSEVASSLLEAHRRR